MGPPMLITNFGRLSAADTIVLARLVKSRMTDHPDVKEPFPVYVTSLDALGNNTDMLEAAVHAAANKDLEKIRLKNDCCETVKKDLGKIAKHAELVAQGNVNILQTLGYKMRKQKSKTRTRLPPDPPLMAVMHGKLPSVFAFLLTKQGKTASFEVDQTDGDPTVEANWKREGSHVLSKFESTGYQAGTRYSFRARSIGPGGTSAWSPVVTIMSL